MQGQLKRWGFNPINTNDFNKSLGEHNFVCGYGIYYQKGLELLPLTYIATIATFIHTCV